MEDQQTTEIKPDPELAAIAGDENQVIDAAKLIPYGERYIPKDPVRIDEKNFIKRYKVDKRLKPIRAHYARIVEEKIGSGVTRDKKELIVKQLVYHYVMNYYAEEDKKKEAAVIEGDQK